MKTSAAGLSTQIIPAASSHFSAAVTVDCVFRFLLSLCEYLRCFDISKNIRNILFMPSRSSTSCTEGVNFFSTYKTQISHVFGYKMLKHTHTYSAVTQDVNVRPESDECGET